MQPPPKPIPNSFEETWRPRRRTIALFGIMLTLLLWLGNACRPCYIGAGEVDVSKAILGSQTLGLQIAEPQTAQRTIIYLTGRHGDVIPRPSWTVRDSELWYWSPADNSLVQIQLSGRRRYLEIPQKFTRKVPVASLYSTSKGFLLNLSPMAPYLRRQDLKHSAGVIYVPLDNPAQARLLPGLQDARGNPASEAFYGRGVKGSIIRWDNAARPTQTLTQNAADWIYWDVAPQSNRIAFISDNQACLLDDDRVIWKSSDTFSLYGIGFAPYGDVWVSEDTMAHTGGVAVLAADSGRFRGWHIRSGSPVAPPFHEVDKDLLSVLKHLGNTK